MQVQPSLITPGEAFDIYYFLRNPIDTATYYIKAVIYDVRNGQQITTVTLTQSSVNSHLFIATLQAPPDPPGIGRNIVAIASVYTDSGYTTKSDAYEEQESYFLVKAQVPFAGGGGGVDYQTLREIFATELDKRPHPAPPELPFEGLFGALGALQREVNRIPKEHADTEGITTALADLKQAVADLPAPEPVKFDTVIKEIHASRDTLLTTLKTIPEAVFTRFSDAFIALKRAVDGLGDNLKSTIDTTLKRELGQKEFKFSINPLSEQQKPSPQPSPIDVSHLMT